MKLWLIYAIGAWRVKREGRVQAEQPHPFWDRAVRLLLKGGPR